MKTKILRRMKNAPYRIIRHMNDGDGLCDVCGKKGAALAIVFGKLYFERDFSKEGPLWLNNEEIYWVGAVCLKDLGEDLGVKLKPEQK